MESISSSLQPTDLEEICTTLIDSANFRMLMRIGLQNDWDFLDQICTSTNVSKNTLDALLYFAINTDEIHEIFCKIVEIASPSSFSVDWINRLITFPNEYIKISCIISLAHKDLPISLLKILCETNCCFECYFSLVVSSYTSPLVGVDEFEANVLCFINSPYSVLSKELNLEIQAHKPNESEKSRIWMGHMQKKLNQ